MSGVRRLANPQVLETLTVKSRAVLERRAFGLQAEISGVLEAAKVGRSGQPPNPQNPPSVPGDPPARQSGRLINSIQARKRNEDVWEVGPAAESYTEGPPYPVFLEFGTRRTAPRPFVRPGVARFKAKLR